LARAMTKRPDDGARLRALTDLRSTLLIEAAAGTGKTALISGRLVMLLAEGASPASIAAITFTELAASEFAARAHRTIDELLAGQVPAPMRVALPRGLSDKQRDALRAATAKLDDLTTTTIHGFCQSIITSYAVEADIDPGARILDAAQADTAFDTVFEQWFRRRLSGSVRAGDPIAALSKEDPRQVVDTLRRLARFRLRHRDARPEPADLSGRPDIDFVASVDELRRWAASAPPEPQTAQFVTDLGVLVRHFDGSFAVPPDFERLWLLAHPERLASMRGKTLDLKDPPGKSAWEKAAGRARGWHVAEEAAALFAHVDDRYRTVLGRVATALVAMLSAELDEVLAAYGAFKRAAASLDFDDLLEHARNVVRRHESVRRALGGRFAHILIDEFQDTDPVQSEILFLIAAQEARSTWKENPLRPGALFMVGDPKQAIYQFRGANVHSYDTARAIIERQFPGNLLQVTSNFRSRPDILTYVNRCFQGPLSRQGQPGYVALTPTHGAPEHDLPCATRLTVDLALTAGANEIRDAEAEAVAQVCARLIGNLKVRGPTGAIAPLAAGGIALLAPTGTDLWRYERALEEQGLPIASQAGKGLFRRQEVQDLLALARLLADPRDTLAFGAFMRGPLVGLSEEELLDIAHALPASAGADDRPPRFSVSTNPDHIAHAHARATLLILQDLRRRARTTTPVLLLGEAVERLAVRPILMARERDRSARAAANVGAFLEWARPYAVRGLKRLVRDATREWQAGAQRAEGRVDAEGDAIEVVTIHSAKGLEWPVVITINTATQLRARDEFVHRQSDNTLHWVLGDAVPPGLAAALTSDEEYKARENERLWYVACTRATELLVVPELASAKQKSWARVVELGHQDLPEIDLSGFVRKPIGVVADGENRQTSDVFAAEQATIAEQSRARPWIRPSRVDPDRIEETPVIVADIADAPEAAIPIGAGRVRGLVLHKLLEEILTGELPEDAPALTKRAKALTSELVAEIGPGAPKPAELAATALHTLRIPEVAALRAKLIAELPVYATLRVNDGEAPLAGRADAVAMDDGKIAVVIDWKSDVAPATKEVEGHAHQLLQYMTATSAPRGLLVYMTPGTVRWVDRS